MRPTSDPTETTREINNKMESLYESIFEISTFSNDWPTVEKKHQVFETKFESEMKSKMCNEIHRWTIGN